MDRGPGSDYQKFESLVFRKHPSFKNITFLFSSFSSHFGSGAQFGIQILNTVRKLFVEGTEKERSLDF
jgi:hypothetical protein